MKRAVIECSRIETLPQLHRALAQALDFPDYYGANLDALADCLGDLCGDTVLTLRMCPSCGSGWARMPDGCWRSWANAPRTPAA